MEKIKIICAAVKAGDLISVGERHADIHSAFYKIYGEYPSDYTEGFLTTEREFVDRVEALKIARLANQILDESQVMGNELYSEDIY